MEKRLSWRAGTVCKIVGFGLSVFDPHLFHHFLTKKCVRSRAWCMRGTANPETLVQIQSDTPNQNFLYKYLYEKSNIPRTIKSLICSYRLRKRPLWCL